MDQRSLAILNQFIQMDSYLTVENLARMFNVSRRTIYNDLNKIDDWLQEHNLAKIKQIRGKGLYIERDTKQKIGFQLSISENPYYEFSPSERKAWIYLHIVGANKGYFLEDIRQLFQVSRNTVLEDIKALKKEVAMNQLIITSKPKQGYVVEGRENDIRRTIIQYLSVVTPENGWYEFTTQLQHSNNSGKTTYLLKPFSIFDHFWLKLLKQYLFDYETHYRIELIDDGLNDLVIWFYFFLKRIQKKQYVHIDPVEKEVIQSTDEYSGAQMLCNSIAEKLTIDIPLDEVHYLTKYLLSAKVNYNLSAKPESQEMRMLLDVVKKMVEDFQMNAAIQFPEQEHMIENLLLHLKPAYYRIKYGIKVENILCDSVKETYPEVFHLTKKVIQHFENLVEQPVHENEIAYIAMHFGGWLRKEGVTLPSRRKKLLIVCTNGLGTSKLLESQLESLVSNVDIIGVTSLRDYEKTDLNVDFIVSTIPLPNRGVPVFVVNPVLDNKDKEYLLKNINSSFQQPRKGQVYSVDTIMDMVQRYATIQEEQSLRQEIKRYLHSPLDIDNRTKKPSLADLLPVERLIFKSKVNNWKTAIQQGARPLLEERYIQKRYISKMIHYVEKKGPYIVISDYFALPHASPEDGVNQTGLSMLHLQEPVDLLGKPVRTMIVLASWDNMQHLRALEQLTRLLSQHKDMIMNMNDKEQMLKLIHSYSTD